MHLKIPESADKGALAIKESADFQTKYVHVHLFPIANVKPIRRGLG